MLIHLSARYPEPVWVGGKQRSCVLDVDEKGQLHFWLFENEKMSWHRTFPADNHQAVLSDVHSFLSDSKDVRSETTSLPDRSL